jgi:hypothetical protein
MPENLCPERAQKRPLLDTSLCVRGRSDMRLWAILFLAGCSSAEPVTLQTALKSKLFSLLLFFPTALFIGPIVY